MLKVLENNKRQKITENDEVEPIQLTEKPADLFQRILDNIDRYSYLCDDTFAGPITKKELLSHITGFQSLAKVDSETDSNKNKIKLKKIPKAPLTIPVAPKFQTEARLSIKDKQSLKTSEELEMEEINKKKALIESQIKMNQDTVKQLDSYEKPVFQKKESTVFKEFNFQTSERSSKHSEFRKKNIEKLEEKREVEKSLMEDKKQEEKNNQEKKIKFYNSWGQNLHKPDENNENIGQFVSLKSKIEGVLMRKEDEDVKFEQSPKAKVVKRHLTTPKSPELSVKKR